MSDPINKSQAMPVVKDEVKIPTEAEHKAFIRRLWRACIGAAFFIFLTVGGVVLALFLKGYDSKKIVEVSTSVFQVLVLSYGMGFFVPAFLTSLINMALGVKMSRKGLDIGEETARVIEKVDKAIDNRLARADRLLDTLDHAVKGIDKGEGPLLKVFREEMGKLRAEIKGARTRTEDELNEALDQGELEAAAAAGGKPELEARSPHGPGFPCPCNDGNICQEGVCPCGGVCHGHGACGCAATCSCVQCACPYCKAALQRFADGRGRPEGAQAH